MIRYLPVCSAVAQAVLRARQLLKRVEGLDKIEPR
jgi:hypothetical protein